MKYGNMGIWEYGNMGIGNWGIWIRGVKREIGE
jgi:hypothetical protein